MQFMTDEAKIGTGLHRVRRVIKMAFMVMLAAYAMLVVIGMWRSR